MMMMIESFVRTTYDLWSRTNSYDSSCKRLGQSLRCIVDHRCCRVRCSRAWLQDWNWQ